MTMILLLLMMMMILLIFVMMLMIIITLMILIMMLILLILKNLVMITLLMMILLIMMILVMILMMIITTKYTVRFEATVIKGCLRYRTIFCQVYEFFYLKKKCFILEIPRFLCFGEFHRSQNLWHYRRHCYVEEVKLMLIFLNPKYYQNDIWSNNK